MVSKTNEIFEVLHSLYSEEEVLDLKVTTEMLSDIKGILVSKYTDEDWHMSEIRAAVKYAIECQSALKMYEFETRLRRLANSYDFVTFSIGYYEEPDKTDDPIQNNAGDILAALNKELNAIVTELHHFNERPHN